MDISLRVAAWVNGAHAKQMKTATRIIATSMKYSYEL